MSKVFIISDCHGNIDGLMRALQNKGIVSANGQRQLARRHKVISIGDLANCVGDSVGGDRECLNLVGEVIDFMLVGNHEIPYLDPANKFWGFVWDQEIHHKILSLMNEGKILSCALAGNILITHAGLSKSNMSVNMDAKESFDNITEHWNARNFSVGAFTSIGRARGGYNHCGGILWCDFDKEFVPTDFPQIVGHTPRCVRMKGNAICIDVGAKDQETEPFILEVS